MLPASTGMPARVGVWQRGEAFARRCGGLECGENKAKLGRIWQPMPQFTCIAPILPLFETSNRNHIRPVSTLSRKGRVSFVEEGIHTMRKIILAAAIATSALGLAACSETTETEAGEAVDAAATDAAAATDTAVEGAEAAADATAEGAEAAADAAADTAEATADAAADVAAEAEKAAE